MDSNYPGRIPISNYGIEFPGRWVVQKLRTYSAGVFSGYLESRDGQEGIMRQARRLWYWDGAASLSQLAVDGVSKPQNCKFPCSVDKTVLTQIIEIISCTETAKKSISEVPVWKV